MFRTPKKAQAYQPETEYFCAYFLSDKDDPKTLQERAFGTVRVHPSILDPEQTHVPFEAHFQNAAMSVNRVQLRPFQTDSQNDQQSDLSYKDRAAKGKRKAYVAIYELPKEQTEPKASLTGVFPPTQAQKLRAKILEKLKTKILNNDGTSDLDLTKELDKDASKIRLIGILNWTTNGCDGQIPNKQLKIFAKEKEEYLNLFARMLFQIALRSDYEESMQLQTLELPVVYCGNNIPEEGPVFVFRHMSTDTESVTNVISLPDSHSLQLARMSEAPEAVKVEGTGEVKQLNPGENPEPGSAEAAKKGALPADPQPKTVLLVHTVNHEDNLPHLAKIAKKGTVPLIQFSEDYLPTEFPAFQFHKVLSFALIQAGMQTKLEEAKDVMPPPETNPQLAEHDEKAAGQANKGKEAVPEVSKDAKSAAPKPINPKIVTHVLTTTQRQELVKQLQQDDKEREEKNQVQEVTLDKEARLLSIFDPKTNILWFNLQMIHAEEAVELMSQSVYNAVPYSAQKNTLQIKFFDPNAREELAPALSATLFGGKTPNATETAPSAPVDASLSLASNASVTPEPMGASKHPSDADSKIVPHQERKALAAKTLSPPVPDGDDLSSSENLKFSLQLPARSPDDFEGLCGLEHEPDAKGVIFEKLNKVKRIDLQMKLGISIKVSDLTQPGCLVRCLSPFIPYQNRKSERRVDFILKAHAASHPDSDDLALVGFDVYPCGANPEREQMVFALADNNAAVTEAIRTALKDKGSQNSTCLVAFTNFTNKNFSDRYRPLKTDYYQPFRRVKRVHGDMSEQVLQAEYKNLKVKDVKEIVSATNVLDVELAENGRARKVIDFNQLLNSIVDPFAPLQTTDQKNGESEVLRKIFVIVPARIVNKLYEQGRPTNDFHTHVFKFLRDKLGVDSEALIFLRVIQEPGETLTADAKLDPRYVGTTQKVCQDLRAAILTLGMPVWLTFQVTNQKGESLDSTDLNVNALQAQRFGKKQTACLLAEIPVLAKVKPEDQLQLSIYTKEGVSGKIYWLEDKGKTERSTLTFKFPVNGLKTVEDMSIAFHKYHVRLLLQGAKELHAKIKIIREFIDNLTLNYPELADLKKGNNNKVSENWRLFIGSLPEGPNDWPEPGSLRAELKSLEAALKLQLEARPVSQPLPQRDKPQEGIPQQVAPPAADGTESTPIFSGRARSRYLPRSRPKPEPGAALLTLGAR